jgi:hypothetical protein
MLEQQLFQPIKDLFESDGFKVDGEVKKIDMVCVKNDVFVAIELKKELNLKVITQASLRQKTMDIVYIGIYSPKSLFNKNFKEKLYLLKRLGIGLIIVSPKSLQVSVYQDPIVSDISKYQYSNKKKRDQTINEMHNRKLKNNVGGVSKTKIMSSYREDCLLVLNAIKDFESASGKQIKEITSVSKSTNIMYKNYYGWFEKVKKGLYKINNNGKEALVQYHEIISELIKGE